MRCRSARFNKTSNSRKRISRDALQPGNPHALCPDRARIQNPAFLGVFLASLP